MTNRPKSQLIKAHSRHKQRQDNLDEAATQYLLQLHAVGTKAHLGVRKFASNFKVDKCALQRRVHGRHSQVEENRRRTKLSQESEDKLVEFITGCADRAVPLNRKKVVEEAECLLKMEHRAAGQPEPQKTPAGGLFSATWFDRFMARHNDHVKTAWSASQDSQRSSGLNPTVVNGYFKGTDDEYKAANACAGNIWATDETFLSDSIELEEHVVCRADSRQANAQQGGSREITTVMATICADGSSLPPFMIFKGQALQDIWVENNPGEIP